MILDNLIAEARAKPMIVVMPFNIPAFAQKSGGGSRAENLALFEPDLISELIPFVQSRYRVRKRPQYRAIAGLSMGGEQAVTIGVRHPELFGWVGGFSAALFSEELELRFGSFLANPAEATKRLKLLWIGLRAAPGCQLKLRRSSQRSGIRHRYLETEGSQIWPVWRLYLIEFVSLYSR